MDTTQTMLQMIFNAADNFAQNNYDFANTNSSVDSDNTFKDMLVQKSESAYETKDTGEQVTQKPTDSNTETERTQGDSAQQKPSSEQEVQNPDYETQAALSGASIQMIDLSVLMGANVSEVAANTQNMNLLQLNALQGTAQQNAQGTASAGQENLLQSNTETQQAVTAPQQSAEGQQAETQTQSGNAQTSSTDVFSNSNEETQTKNSGTELQAGTENTLFTKTDVIPVKVGQTAQTAAPQQTQQPQQALANAIITADANGLDSVTIKLAPENLGNLVIDIQRSPTGEISIILRPETEAAAKLLSEHSSNLASLLASNGNEAKIQVEQAEHPDKMWQDSNRDASDSQSNNKQQQEQDKQEESNDFLNKLRLGLVISDYQSA